MLYVEFGTLKVNYPVVLSAISVRYLRSTPDPPDLVGTGLGIPENYLTPCGDRNHAAA
jgi:hypothetical protein